MTSRLRLRLALTALVPTLAAVLGPAQAQEWSPEQREVWGVVEEYNARFTAKDADGFFAHVHPQATGWYAEALHPSGVEADRRFMDAFFARPWRIVASDVRPAAIGVFGDTAVVHYYYSGLYEGEDGDQEMERERWTDVLKREGGRWLMIGSHGGTVELAAAD